MASLLHRAAIMTNVLSSSSSSSSSSSYPGFRIGMCDQSWGVVVWVLAPRMLAPYTMTDNFEILNAKSVI